MDILASQYRLRFLNAGRWELDDLRHLLVAAGDLAELMGGYNRFQGELRRKLYVSRFPRKTRFAAVALPLIGVIYFESASWRHEPDLKWQTVHELAHIWDIRRFFRLSSGLKQATGSRYRGFARQLPIPLKYDPGRTWLLGRKAPLNALEDWADSVATYVYQSYAGQRNRLISPVRWDYVSQQMQVKLPYPVNWDSRF